MSIKYLKHQFYLIKYTCPSFSKFISSTKNTCTFNQPKKLLNKFNQVNFTNIRTITKMPRYNYPTVRRDDNVTENFHGQDITDHYRWLEDPGSEETKKFVNDQNALTNSFFENCKHRKACRDRITELWNYPKFGSPFKQGDYYYFFKNTGLQNQSVLYQQKSLDSEPVEFLDPNKFAEDGTTSLQQYSFSEDGSLFAYIICEKGSDWGKIKFKSVTENNKDLEDLLENIKFSCLSWTHDNKGLFYNSYPKSLKSDGTATEKNEYQQLFYHRLGTKQSEDLVCVKFPDEPKWMGHVTVSDCGNYLVLGISCSCDPNNQLWYYDLHANKNLVTDDIEFVKLVPNFDAKYSYITNEGSLFLFKTNLNALKYKLVTIDLSEPNPKFKDFLPEKEDVLQDVSCINKTKLLINYMHDCKDEMYLYDLNTGKELKKFKLEIGTVLEISSRKKDDFFFFKFGSFTSPGDIFLYKFESDDSNIQSNEPKLFRRSEFKGLDLSNFKTEQVFFESKDGTKIPMFIVSKKNLEKSHNNPALLYGYGGFNISLTPTFSVVRLIWLQHFNGIYCCANLRGGGEYGEAWYNGGRLAKKQNVFDDFIAAAEYLTENKYTNKDRLAINGGSNGGLLVTATINQRPDLFKVAIADVAVCDMLRFHKFTIGSYWTSDYGCSDNKDEFDTMIKYSPLHTIAKNKEYPFVLMATADHDDRVVPSHSYKYIAELQHQNGHQEKPFLIRIETKAGHGAGKPTSKIIEEHADKYSYIAEVMDLKWED